MSDSNHLSVLVSVAIVGDRSPSVPLYSHRGADTGRTIGNTGSQTWKVCASDSNRDSSARRAGLRHPGPIRTSPASGGRIRTHAETLPGSTDQKARIQQ
jgi:hypothetical protein